MVDLWEGLRQAVWLVVTLDAELAEITLRSLFVTLTALAIAVIFAMPLAALLAVLLFSIVKWAPDSEQEAVDSNSNSTVSFFSDSSFMEDPKCRSHLLA